MPERGLDAQYSFALPQGMSCEIALDGVLTRVSEGCAAILGQDAEAVLGHRLTDFIHSEDCAAVLAALARLASGGDADAREPLLLRGRLVRLARLADDAPRAVGPDLRRGPWADRRASASGGVVHASGGSPARRLEQENHLLREQTEELAAHRNALQRVLELNHALLDASIDGIRLVDLDGRTILSNSVIEELTTDVFGLPRYATLPERSTITSRLEEPERYLATMDAIASIRPPTPRTSSSSPTSGASSSATGPVATPQVR